MTFRIRGAQVAALRCASRRTFCEALATHVNTHFPERTWELSFDVVIVKVEALVDRATSLGLGDEGSAATYVILSFECGGPVEDHAMNGWVRSLLQHESLPSAEKVRLIDAVIHGETPFSPVASLLS